MRKLSLLKPDVRNGIMKNEQAEKFSFLAVPEHIGIEELKRDIKLGAVHYKELLKTIEKEKDSKYVVVTAQSTEMGYMAIAYMAACYNEKNGYFYDKDIINDEKSGVEEWSENNFQIPIIRETEISIFNNSNINDSLPFGNVFGQANCFVKPNRPYWLDCTASQVCVVVSDSCFFYGGEQNALADNLDIFKNNERVYILVEQRDIGDDLEWDTDENHTKKSEEEWYDDGSMEKIKYLILNYAADDVVVRIEKEFCKTYYRQVLKSFFDENHITVHKGFAYRKIVDIIVAMNDKNKCELIEKIVKYAIKDKDPDETKELVTKDFDFIDRFVKVRVKADDKKSSDKRIRSELIGMDSVKEQVFDIVNLMKYNKIRRDMKLSGSVYHNVHAMLGAPGTAKTTMAKLMGQMMVEQGLLRGNRFICVNGAELKGKYVGHSAPKTKALFENYDIIVIDEAYSLVDSRGETDSFGNEAIAQLIIELEEHSMDKLVIFAGYGGKNVSSRDNKMLDFFEANPGIKSRITSTIYFDSYSAEEMVKIFYNMAKVQNFIVDERVQEEVYKHFVKRVKDKNFGNGREARSLLETCILFSAKRLMTNEKEKYTKNQMQTLIYDDIINAIARIERARMENVIEAEKAIGFRV